MSSPSRSRAHTVRTTVIWIVVLVAILALAFYLKTVVRDNAFVRTLVEQFGYAGIFSVALLSGFNIAVPIPVASFLPVFLEANLNFWISILVITAGMTVADAIAYSLGKAGRDLFFLQYEERLVQRLEALQSRSHIAAAAALFLFASFVPLPNEVLVVPLGLMAYPLHLLFPAIFLGNLVFNTLYAAGLSNLFSLF